MENPNSPDSDRSDTFKSLNRVLLGLALLSAGWSLFGTTVNVNGFRGLELAFRQFKVQLPAVALLFLRHQVVLDVLRLVLAGTCVYVTARNANHRRTVYFNVAGIVLPLLIWLAQLTAFYNSSAVLLEIWQQILVSPQR
jgi:hypothetical protein